MSNKTNQKEKTYKECTGNHIPKSKVRSKSEKFPTKHAKKFLNDRIEQSLS